MRREKRSTEWETGSLVLVSVGTPRQVHISLALVPSLSAGCVGTAQSNGPVVRRCCEWRSRTHYGRRLQRSEALKRGCTMPQETAQCTELVAGKPCSFQSCVENAIVLPFLAHLCALENSPYSSNQISAIAVGRSFEVEVSRTRSFSRARNNLAFRVPIPIPKIAAVSLMDRSSS